MYTKRTITLEPIHMEKWDERKAYKHTRTQTGKKPLWINKSKKRYKNIGNRQQNNSFRTDKSMRLLLGKCFLRLTTCVAIHSLRSLSLSPFNKVTQYLPCHWNLTKAPSRIMYSYVGCTVRRGQNKNRRLTASLSHTHTLCLCGVGFLWSVGV